MPIFLTIILSVLSRSLAAEAVSGWFHLDSGWIMPVPYASTSRLLTPELITGVYAIISPNQGGFSNNIDLQLISHDVFHALTFSTRLTEKHNLRVYREAQKRL